MQNTISIICSRKSRALFSLVLIALVSSCSSISPTRLIETSRPQKKIICLQVPPISQFLPRSFEWLKGTDDVTGLKVFGLTPKDYENLSVNTAGVLVAQNQRTEQVLYYQDCIRKFNAQVTAENAEAVVREQPVPEEKSWWKFW